MLETAILIFTLIVLAAFLAAFLAVVLIFKDELAGKLQRRKLLQYETMYRYKPDANGNYPGYFDPRSGTFFAPSPGNRPVPEQLLFNAGGGIKPVVERQMVIQHYGGPVPEPSPAPDQGGMDISEGEIREIKPVQELNAGIQVGVPGSPLTDNLASKSSVQPVEVHTDSQIRALLETFKRNGRAKIESIQEAAQVSSKSGKKFLMYSAYWETLPKFEPWKLNEEVVKMEPKEVE
jgi:hypothetical protein